MKCTGSHLVCCYFLLLANTKLFAQAVQPCQLQHVVVSATSGVPILTWQDATKADIGNNVHVTLAQGSYNSASIVIKANSTTCKDISFSVTNLTSTSNPADRLSEKSATIRYVKRWYQAGSAWIDIKPAEPRKLTPELLLNDPELVKIDVPHQRNYLKVIRDKNVEYIDVSTNDHLDFAGSLILPIDQYDIRDADELQPLSFAQMTSGLDIQQLWVKLAAAPDAKSGTYRGDITIRQEGRSLLSIPLEITVLPFSLPPPKLEYSIYYRGQLTPDGKGSISSEYKNIAQYTAELQDIKTHGVSNTTIFHEFDNPSLLKRELDVRRKAGFTDNKVYYMGLSASAATNDMSASIQTKKIQQLIALIRSAGYSELYLYGVDEAKGEAQRKQSYSWGETHKAGAKVFASGGTGTYKNTDGTLDTLILAYEPDSGEVKLFHDASKRVLTYAFPQTGPENPEIFRRNYGIKLWIAGVDGAMPYAYMHAFGSSWNDFDHAQYRDHMFAYPTSTGVIDTLAWEGFHEAIEDVRYLTAVEDATNRLTNDICNSPLCESKRADARQLLQELRRGQHQDNLDILRTRLVDLLTKLNVELSPPQAPANVGAQSG